MTKQTRPRYRTFLVRCWEECTETGETRLWRWSLEDTRTGQRRGYEQVSELARALEAALAEGAGGEKP